MGRIQQLSRSSSQAMDIDPGSSTWNSLCPSYLDSQRNRIHMQDDASGAVIGSPPPAGPPKILWNDSFPNAEQPTSNPTEKNASVDPSELSERVQSIRLQQPHPMIICETVEDEKVDSGGDKMCTDTESLAVPSVDVANEKKRPPMSVSH